MAFPEQLSGSFLTLYMLISVMDGLRERLCPWG